MASDYANLAQKLQLPAAAEADRQIIVRAVRTWLSQNSGWLLIFDNAPIPDDVRSFLPQGQTGPVLITSRNQHWGGTARLLTVQQWEPTESRSFLEKRTG